MTANRATFRGQSESGSGSGRIRSLIARWLGLPDLEARVDSIEDHLAVSALHGHARRCRARSTDARDR